MFSPKWVAAGFQSGLRVMKNQLFEHVRNSIVFSEIPTVYWYTKKLYLKVPTSEDSTLERDFFGGRDKKRFGTRQGRETRFVDEQSPEDSGTDQ